jgi:signal recognition particle subunit SRP68
MLTRAVLSLLSKERAVYGLRNGDYERYRCAHPPRSFLPLLKVCSNSRHCANKLHRLRQVSGLTCGKGKVFKKPPPLTASIIKDVKYGSHFKYPETS